MLLEAWLEGLTEPWLTAREGEGTWSPLEVVAHLLDNEEVDWWPRLELIHEHGESRPFTPFERDGFRQRYGDWALDRLMRRFAAVRREHLDLWRSCTSGRPTSSAPACIRRSVASPCAS